MELNQIKPPKGARKKRKIVGRGRASGLGKTSGRGENGQRSRAGRWAAKASEGGQVRLIRRLPKVGFRSKRPILNQVVKIEELNRFDAGAVVHGESLKDKGLIKSLNKPFKILGNGELKKALVFETESLSAKAREKILAAGGKIAIPGGNEEPSNKKKKK